MNRNRTSCLAVVVASTVLFVAGSAAAQNLVANPGFSADMQLGGWQDTAGKSWSADDSDGDGSSGSVQIEIAELASAAITQCVPVTAGTEYDFGADVRLSVQGQAMGRAGVVVRTYTDGLCEDEIPAFPANVFSTENVATDWTHVSGDFVTAAGAVAALVEARATKTSGSSGQTLTANLDDVFLRPTSGVTTTSTIPLPMCADPSEPLGEVTASDALFVLRASVDSIACEICVCDVNGSGDASASDAATRGRHRRRGELPGLRVSRQEPDSRLGIEPRSRASSVVSRTRRGILAAYSEGRAGCDAPAIGFAATGASLESG